MDKLIVVVGITGVQGSSVANTFINLLGWKVRGITRNTSSEKARAWSNRGVEIVSADLDKSDSLVKAFEGASVIFGVTDFWTIFQDPTSLTKKKAEQNITEYCFDVEVQQGKNLVNAAATVEQLELLVFSSMAKASKWSNGKFSRIYHMDSKAAVAEYAQSLPGLRDKFSQIQAPIYFNLFWQWGLPTAPAKQADGSYRIRGPGPANVPIPMGDVQNDFGKCVKAIVEAKPGLNLLAVGEMLSWDTIIETWCESQGVPSGGYEEHTIDSFVELHPGELSREFGENVLFAQQFGYGGSDPTIVKASDTAWNKDDFLQRLLRENGFFSNPLIGANVLSAQ